MNNIITNKVDCDKKIETRQANELSAASGIIEEGQTKDEVRRISRQACINRSTKETNIKCNINLDGEGNSVIGTEIGFFNHMVTLFAFHSKIDIKLKAVGDLEVCDHHIIEDIGIVLGQCVKGALGDKKGIERYGFMSIPMDETLAQVTLDISGRSFLVYNCELKRDMVGGMSCEMVEEFLRAFAFNAGITLHVHVPYGNNDHHKIEAIFKALGKALRQAIEITSEVLPSTKGAL